MDVAIARTELTAAGFQVDAVGEAALGNCSGIRAIALCRSENQFLLSL